MKGPVMPIGTQNIRAKILLTAAIPAMVPWAAIFFYNSLPDFLTRYLLFTKGWVAWTLFEYCMHRWAFHRDGKEDGKRQDPFLHNHHHSHPEDIRLTLKHRIIAIVVILASIFSLFKGHVLLAYLGGILTGGALYILMHWFLHQHFAYYIFPNLVRQHIWHHCKYPDKCYGVTSGFWDRAFKTLPTEYKTLPEKIIRFYYKHEELEPEMIQRLDQKLNFMSRN